MTSAFAAEEVLLNDVRVEMVNKLGSKYYRNFGKIGTGKLRSILGKMAAIWVQQVDSQGNKIGEELLLEDATFHSHSYWKPVRESVDYLYDQVRLFCSLSHSWHKSQTSTPQLICANAWQSTAGTTVD